MNKRDCDITLTIQLLAKDTLRNGRLRILDDAVGDANRIHVDVKSPMWVIKSSLAL